MKSDLAVGDTNFEVDDKTVTQNKDMISVKCSLLSLSNNTDLTSLGQKISQV